MCKRRLVVKEQEQPSTITPDSQITFLNSVADPQAGHNTRKQNSKSKEIRSHLSLSLSLSLHPLADKYQLILGFLGLISLAAPLSSTERTRTPYLPSIHETSKK